VFHPDGQIQLLFQAFRTSTMSTAESKPQTRPLISPATPNSLDFLSGGGEMGERIRSHDWRSTPLGAPEGWPQSLKTAVRIMLTSRQAFWLG